MTDEPRDRSPVEALARLWWIWFAAYFGSGIYANLNGTTSLLAGTVDRVETTWIALVFLNLPLQMMLAISALLVDRSPRRSLKRLAIGIGVTLSLLIVVHLILSFVT